MGRRPAVGVTQFVAQQSGIAVIRPKGAGIGQDQALARRAGIGLHPRRRRAEQGITHRVDALLAGELDGDGTILLKRCWWTGIAVGRDGDGGGKEKLKHWELAGNAALAAHEI
jgi:hypothetical protein